MAILKLFLHLPVGNGGFSRKSVPIYGPWCSDGMDFLSFLVERFTGWNGYRIVTPENRNEVISPDFTHLPSGPVTHLYSKLIQKMNTPKNITKHNHKSSQNIKQHPKKKTWPENYPVKPPRPSIPPPARMQRWPWNRSPGEAGPLSGALV